MGTTTTPHTTPTPTDTGDDDSLTHVYCYNCYPDGTNQIAFCGKDLTNDPPQGTYTHQEPDTCIVCAELSPKHLHPYRTHQ